MPVVPQNARGSSECPWFPRMPVVPSETQPGADLPGCPPRPGRGGAGAGRRGEVLDGEAEGLKDRQLCRTSPAGPGAGEQLTELSFDLLRSDGARRGGQQVVTGLGEHRVAAVGEYRGHAHRRRVELALAWEARANRVDVSTGREPIALQHWLG